MQVKKIGVSPSSALAEFARLFRALSQAFPVVFTPHENLEPLELDAIWRIGSDAAQGPNLSNSAVPVLVMSKGHSKPDSPLAIGFTGDSLLDSTLRNQTLHEQNPPLIRPLTLQDNDRPLAMVGSYPLWIHRPSGRAGLDWVGLEPEELDRTRCLRDECRGWRFIRILPILQFLRRLTTDSAWQPPPQRATFLIDDPNLHRPRYGYLDFKALAGLALAHNFHVVIATVPLDQWYVNRRVAALLYASGGRLSLTPHGNNHLRRELDRHCNASLAMSELAQALLRIRHMEKITDLTASRVMSPPHGVCSQVMIHAMRLLGFDAATCAQPIPWLTSPPPDEPLTGWHCAQLVDNHFPILHRRSIPHCLSDRAHRDELVIMSFLHQPIILCGHHRDLSLPDALSTIAEMLNRLGPVQWGDLTQLTESNYETRSEESTLHVRAFARRIKIDLSKEIKSIVFEAPEGVSPSNGLQMSVDGHSWVGHFGEKHSILNTREGTSHRLTMQVHAADEIDPITLPMPPWTPRPYLRRAFTELRDRLTPLIRRKS